MSQPQPIPPRNGEGDRAKRGGGGSKRAVRPVTALARRLRREMSLPEIILWRELRGKKLGAKFHKQFGIGPYVVDFYCCPARLAIEVEGEVHDRGDRPERDRIRDAFLVENRHHVLHVRAQDVLSNLDGVLQAIAARMSSPLHHASHGPPPRAGEE